MKSYDAAIYRSMPIRKQPPNSSRLNNKINYKRGSSVEQKETLKLDIDPNDNIHGLITQAKNRPITSLGSPTNNIRINNHKYIIF